MGRFILQIAAIFFGGGAVQLIIFLLRRRPEIRTLDATSGSTALSSANAYITTLQAGETASRTELGAVRTQLDTVERSLRTERAAHTVAIENADREMVRMRGEIATLRTDLGVAQEQIRQLTARLGSS